MPQSTMMKTDKVYPLNKKAGRAEARDKQDPSSLSGILSERRFSEVSSLASLQSGICRQCCEHTWRDGGKHRQNILQTLFYLYLLFGICILPRIFTA